MSYAISYENAVELLHGFVTERSELGETRKKLDALRERMSKEIYFSDLTESEKVRVLASYSVITCELRDGVGAEERIAVVLNKLANGEKLPRYYSGVIAMAKQSLQANVVVNSFLED